MQAVLVRETDLKSELVTLQDELADAERRLATADDESLGIILRQVRQIKRQIASYRKILYEKESMSEIGKK